MDREKNSARSDFRVRVPDAEPDLQLRNWPRRMPQAASKLKDWERRSETWGGMMAAAQRGDHRAYVQLMRELDGWLRTYYARRLPDAAAEDARQEALLAIHAKRFAYIPSRSFGPWVAAIARFKWVDRIRDAARSAALPSRAEMPADNHWDISMSAIIVHGLLRQLSPAQASAIRLVKLEGASVESAANTTGQSESLVKVNIHRGLKRLASLVARDEITLATPANSPATTSSRP